MNEPNPRPCPRVLVVDDDEALRILFRALLVRHGFEVDCATDGNEALVRLRAGDYGAIVLDLMMPLRDGFTLLGDLAESRPELLRRTIICTAINERLFDGVDRAAVFAIVRKPFDIDEFLTTVADCVDQPVRDFSSLYAAALESFEARLPRLRSLLEDDAFSDEELILRSELRRLVEELREAFHRVAVSGRAADFARLARLAGDVAADRSDHSTPSGH